jgi:phage terminase large subunit-like protein
MSRTNQRRGAATRSTSSSTSVPDALSTDPVTAYAREVVAGKRIACRFVKLAARRHIDDLKTGPARGLTWNPNAALFAIRFFGFLRHSKGELAGQPIRLEPWQMFCIGSVYGWFRADGTRRFRTLYQEIPKKNGKSTEAAGIGLLGLVADGELGAEVYAAATKKDQARIVFGEARSMVRTSPELKRKVSVFKLNLSVDSTGSKFEPLSSDEKSADGLNPSLVVIDELHRHKNAALRNLMDSGTASRRQPLLVIITTAGDNDNASAYAIENDYAIKVLEGTIVDDSYFAFITTIDDPKKWDDPIEWAKANPNLTVSVKLDFLAAKAAAAKASPTKKADFMRFHLNVRQSDATRAIDMDVWARNAGEPIDVGALKGRRCFLSLDLSAKQDITATVKLFPPEEGEKRWIIVPRFFTPADTIDERSERDRAQYRLWCDEHWMEATPGNVIDHARVKETILEDAHLYRIEALPYDPWNATQLAVELQSVGLPVAEFIQGLKSFTLPTKEFLNYLRDEKFRHGGNPVLTWMASNLMVQTDKNENMMPTKAKSTGRIDGIVATIMDLGAALIGEHAAKSYLETGNLLIL